MKPLICLLIIILISCGSENNQNLLPVSKKSTVNAEVPLSENDFVIQTDRSYDKGINLDVFVQDTTKTKEVAQFLKIKLNPNKDKMMTIFFFDKKENAGIINKSINDKSISSKEWDIKYKQFLDYCSYDYSPYSQDETFEFNKHK